VEACSRLINSDSGRFEKYETEARIDFMQLKPYSCLYKDIAFENIDCRMKIYSLTE